MLKRVQAHISTMETQQVSINGNFALDYALLAHLVINTSKQCQKSVMGCVVTQSSRHNKLASIICAKLLTEDLVVLTHADSDHMRGIVIPLTEHESEEFFSQYCRRCRDKWGKYDAVCLAATTLLDTLGSNGPSNSYQ